MHIKWRCENSGCVLDTIRVACPKVVKMARLSVAKRFRPAPVLAVFSPYSCRARRVLRVCAVLQDPSCGSHSGPEGSVSGAAALGGRVEPANPCRRARRRRAQARGVPYKSRTSSDTPYSRAMRPSRSTDGYSTDGSGDDVCPPKPFQALQRSSLQRPHGQPMPARHDVDAQYPGTGLQGPASAGGTGGGGAAAASAGDKGDRRPVSNYRSLPPASSLGGGAPGSTQAAGGGAGEVGRCGAGIICSLGRASGHSGRMYHSDGEASGSIGDGDGAPPDFPKTPAAAQVASGTDAVGGGGGGGTGKHRRRSRSSTAVPQVGPAAAATAAGGPVDADAPQTAPRRHPPAKPIQTTSTKAPAPNHPATSNRNLRLQPPQASGINPLRQPTNKTAHRIGHTVKLDQDRDQDHTGGGMGMYDIPSLMPGPARPPHAPPPPPLPASCVSQLFYISTDHDVARGGLRVSVYTEHDIRGGGGSGRPLGAGGGQTAPGGGGGSSGGGGGGEAFDMFLDATYCESQLSLTFVSRREMLPGDVVLGLTARSHLDRKGAQIPCYGWKSNGCTYNDHTGGGRLGTRTIPINPINSTIPTSKGSATGRCPSGSTGARAWKAGAGTQQSASAATGTGAGSPSPSEWDRSASDGWGELFGDGWELPPVPEEVEEEEVASQHYQRRAVEAQQPLWGKGDCVELIMRRGAQHQQLLLKVNGQARDVINRLPSLKDWSWYVGLRAGGDVSCAVFQRDQYAVYWGNYAVKRYL